ARECARARVGDGHEPPAAAGKRRVEAIASIEGDALDELFRGEAAHQNEIDEHAAVVLKCAPGHACDLWVGALHSQRCRVVVERGTALRPAEPVPGRAAGSGGSVTDARRDDPQDPRTRVIATSEQRRSPASLALCGGGGPLGPPSPPPG